MHLPESVAERSTAMASGSPVEAAAVSHPQTTINVSPAANQASFKEFNTQGIPVTPALASVMPQNVAAHLAHGQRLIGVSIRHFFFALQWTKMVPTSLAQWEQLNPLIPDSIPVIRFSERTVGVRRDRCAL